jgi:hypothetical protein
MQAAASPEDYMTHTHEYDCIVCGAHFDSSSDLSRHNEAAHIKNATGMERPREDRADQGKPVIGHDRNPRQGFLDPNNDASKAT